jgi:sialate O-acetylesterase
MAMRTWTFLGLAVAAGLLAPQPPARADVKPNGLIGDNMVLQQGIKAPLWGTADDGEEITVTFEDQKHTTTAKGGKWRVDLDPLKAGGGPRELTIAGKNTIHVKNVLVGEVWICSGQSNMEFPLSAAHEGKQAVAESKDPNLRLFTVPHTSTEKPRADVHGKWQVCGPGTVGGFSAVAYYFGRDLRKDLDVPVGLIETNWGGTVCEAWTSHRALADVPELKYLANRYPHGYRGALEDYLKALDRYREQVAKDVDSGKEPPPPPQPPAPSRDPNAFPSSLYNGMIRPLIPYAVKGAIWYQGESNAGRAFEYRTLFPTMIRDWRQRWHEGDFPFLFVQLAPWFAGNPNGPEWAELREAQLQTAQKVPNTAEAVITDVGNLMDIHPKQKEPVGHRLALAALALGYGKKVEYSGPVYESMKVEGNKAILSFTHVGEGLEAKGGPLEGFTIAGPDHHFVKAEAEIRDGHVEVWSKEVEKPVAVRYGWANFPVVNLYNKDGLPATPFRTDDLPLTTGGPKK